VQHLLLEPGDALQALGVDASPEPAPERSGRVLAEVEPVAPVDALEQQVDLDPLDLLPGLTSDRAEDATQCEIDS